MICVTQNMTDIVYDIALAESLLVILLTAIHCWSGARIKEKKTTTHIATSLLETSSLEEDPTTLINVHNALVLKTPKEIIVAGNESPEK